MTTYDTHNIFAKILRCEIPCYKVYENRHTLAFLDIKPRAGSYTSHTKNRGTRHP
jgi:histidine triad (HIT) family protein